MQATRSERCAHPACHCAPAADSKYCGTYCERAVTGKLHEAGDGCGCGHPECETVKSTSAAPGR